MAIKYKINKSSIQQKVKEKKDSILKIILNQKNLERLGLIITRYIKGKLRLGLTVDGKKQRNVTDDAIKNRLYHSKYDGRGANFNSKGRGNLTITGDFLNSLQLEVDGSRLVIGYRGDHIKYTKSKTQISNQELQKHLEDLGFETNGLSDDLINQIRKEIVLIIVRNFKKL